jgi:hypothetical protein
MCLILSDVLLVAAAEAESKARSQLVEGKLLFALGILHLAFSQALGPGFRELDGLIYSRRSLLSCRSEQQPPGLSKIVNHPDVAIYCLALESQVLTVRGRQRVDRPLAMAIT